MSILIKGMEMPECCDECVFMETQDSGFGTDYICGISKKDVDGVCDCPLIEVPPHGRLGDLDRLEQMFADIDNAPYSGFDGTEPFYSAEDAAQIIRLAHTIIEAEEGT